VCAIFAPSSGQKVVVVSFWACDWELTFTLVTSYVCPYCTKLYSLHSFSEPITFKQSRVDHSKMFFILMNVVTDGTRWPDSK